MHDPSEFQRKVFNALACLGVSQVHVEKDQNGIFFLKTNKIWKRVLYFLLRLNTLLKLTFLVLLSCGLFQAEFEFFEKMAILLWFLIFALLTTSERIFCRKHPFFDILIAWWRIEDSVYEHLGKPRKFLQDLRWIALWRVWFQGVIAVVGILAVIVQYDAAPKYCVFAYSIIEKEDDFLKWLFGMHEVFFLVHAWLVYGSVIFFSSLIGAELAYNVDALRQVMEMFSKGIISNHQQSQGSKDALSKRKHFTQALPPPNVYTVDDDNSLQSISRRVRYNPVQLTKEYQNVHMVVTQLNSFAAYNFLYMHGCSYVQMVSDVFQLIQILRSPDADILAALFFAEDMLVCMYMLFRCFKSMALLQPTSISFLEKFRDLLASSSARRKHILSSSDRQLLMKMKPTLRTTALRLGPVLVGTNTVATAMDVLLQYYICVALWK